jgi:OPA family glycerol-3-phosphate transporter-like MFS transporter
MFFVRELDAYPTGKRRVFLLFVVILANFVANYESQIAPVLSLILKDIGISNPEYGLIVSLSVVAAAFGALLGGPLSDRYGRTLILVPGLLLTVLCVFGMAFVHSFGSLLFMRLLLNFIEGGFIGATAGLVRDFSPRMGRALSFGFWSYGTSGSNYGQRPLVQAAIDQECTDCNRLINRKRTAGSLMRTPDVLFT